MSKRSAARRAKAEADAGAQYQQLWQQFKDELHTQRPNDDPVAALAGMIASEWIDSENHGYHDIVRMLAHGCKPVSDPSVYGPYLKAAMEMFDGDMQEFIEQH